MCVIFFYASSQPEQDGYKLILASNRDEFFARDTQTAGKWENAPHVYGGIDLEPGREGGTWLAIGEHKGIFRIGALLNLTGEPKPRDAVAHNNILQPHNNNNNNNHQQSNNHNNLNNHHNYPTTNNKIETLLLGRGMIVADYVSDTAKDHDITTYNSNLLMDCQKYSAFNFVSIEIGDSSGPAIINLLSNVPPGLTMYQQGFCYGFGNSLPAVPFQKVSHGQKQFSEIVEEFGHSDALTISNELLKLLKNKTKFWPDEELKRRAPNWGEYLSALNVNVENNAYGSRTHTVILVDAQNKMHFIEETMKSEDPEGEWQRSHIQKQF